MINKFTNKDISETIKVYTHKSGLRVYVCEKNDYSSAYAIFGTRNGSIDTKFKVSGGEFLEVPEGIAHYLEHKLFESEEQDAFERFAKTGAAANAFTSFDRTCYLFSCSSKFEENFRILLDFVQHPYFTEETVRKEQGIIGQEINMYDDNAGWRVLFNLLCAMYKVHPVRIDIAGTVESIAKINADLLYDCYNTFYNLNNMFICVAGNVEAEKIFALCDELLLDKEKIEIERFMPEEPENVVCDKTEISLPVSIPMFAIGFKEKCDKPQKSVKEKVLTEIILKCIFGNDGKLYKELFDNGLINDNFGTEYFTGYGYASVIVEGESNAPQKVREIINSYICETKKSGIPEADINRCIKAYYGKLVSDYNSVENIVMNMVDSAFFDTDVFEEIEVLKSVTVEDVNERLKYILNTENSSISIVNKKEM